MKRAFIIAQRNGFDLNSIFKLNRYFPVISVELYNNVLIFREKVNHGDPDFLRINFYEFLFGNNNFIECLVKDKLKWEKRDGSLLEMPCKENCEICVDGGDSCIVCPLCDTTISDDDAPYYHNHETNEDYCELCYDGLGLTQKEASAVVCADYHRAQMANIKDIEKLKDYVEGLI